MNISTFFIITCEIFVKSNLKNQHGDFFSYYYAILETHGFAENHTLFRKKVQNLQNVCTREKFLSLSLPESKQFETFI